MLKIKKKYSHNTFRTEQIFWIAMDNYFTLPKFIPSVLWWWVLYISNKTGPERLRQMLQQDAHFNNLYYCVGKYGTLVTCWMDNSLDYYVATLHIMFQEIVVRKIRKPQKTTKNKNHIDKIWGLISVIDIAIPILIDN